MIKSSPETDTPDGKAPRHALRLALFLDFDGTLVEIADRPEQVEVPDELPHTLIALEHHLGGALAIVTGRPLDTIDAFLAPARMAVAAAHGTELRLSDQKRIDPPAEIVSAASDIAAELKRLVDGEPRLVLEQKAGAVALHYRQAPDFEAGCRAAMRAAVGSRAGFQVVEGKMVLEARPVGTDKGGAIRSFMREPPFRDRIPVFIGDDKTDEDGFAAVASLGGIGVKVGDGPTVAGLRAAGVKDVQALLQGLMCDDLPLEHLADRSDGTASRMDP